MLLKFGIFFYKKVPNNIAYSDYVDHTVIEEGWETQNSWVWGQHRV